MKGTALKKRIAGAAVLVLSVVFLQSVCRAGEGDYYFREGTRLLKQAKLDQAVTSLTEAIRLAPDRRPIIIVGLPILSRSGTRRQNGIFSQHFSFHPIIKRRITTSGSSFAVRKITTKPSLFFRKPHRGEAPLNSIT